MTAIATQPPISQEQVQHLAHLAAQTAKNAYNPYSSYSVGAAIITESGKIFTGCNVENATYNSICAERTALVKAVSEGEREIKAVVISLGEGGSPCGPCRQFLYEFNPHMYIYSADREGNLKDQWRLDELLPCGFGPSHLTQ